MRTAAALAVTLALAAALGGCSIYRGVGSTLAGLKARLPVAIETPQPGDAATQDLATRFADALARTADMRAAGTGGTGALTVALNPLDDARQMDGRTDLRATASYRAPDGRVVQTSSGRCFADQLDRCAEQLVREARFARTRL